MTRDEEYPVKEIPDFMLEILNEGGLVEFLRKRKGFPMDV